MDDFSLWPHWRDKYGVAVALEDYYPETLAADPMLLALFAQHKSAVAAIDNIMKAKADDDDQSV